MINKDILYLEHIFQCIEKIEDYTQQMSVEAFQSSNLVQDGCIRQLEVIGEATKRLSDSIRTANPNVPWRDMAGMRDVLIHDYLNVDLEIVTQTVFKSIPQLKPAINKILNGLQLDN